MSLEQASPVRAGDPAAVAFEVGMPHMDPWGLSENWLLKEAGHLHWRRLAASLGTRPGALTDRSGRRLYAAFTHVHLRDARLDGVEEDELLTLGISACPLGRSSHYSHQVLRDAAGKARARLEMLSTLVVRERQGDNHSVARCRPAADPPAGGHPLLREEAQACADAAREVKANGWRERFMLGPSEELPSLDVMEVLPCEAIDYNGAGLFYFASFQAWVDRAHETWGLTRRAHFVRERQLVFHGNVNPGERILLRLVASYRTAGSAWTWTQLLRLPDRAVIADVATCRR